MPQILYTFFDTCDFDHKTIAPFGTHGGSSFAGTPATIRALEPNAAILDGLTISRDRIQDARAESQERFPGVLIEEKARQGTIALPRFFYCVKPPNGSYHLLASYKEARKAA